MSKLVKLICTTVIFISVLGNQKSFGQNKKIVLTYKEYIENVLQFHPIATKADLRIQLANAETLGAKGNLDPTISSDWNQKKFDKKLYYRQFEAKLKFPTKLGIDFIGGYENTDGVFLNPEKKTDNYGLWFLGVEANLLQGLITNERKTAIQQAKIFQNLAENEQQIMLNDLVYDASTAYLIWQQYTYNKLVFEENLSIANTYFDNTKQSFLGGEKTAIDTLESYIQYQDAIANLQKNELGLIKSRQKIENYLWFNNEPVTLQEITQPEDYKNQLFPIPINFENSNLANHPLILASINKLSYIQIEQRLKREKLKPKLKVKYNPLLATSENNISPNYSFNDFKWGFSFSMPLLLRSARADILKGKVKLREIELDISNKRNELQNKIENSWLQQQQLQNQVNLLTQNVENYKRLLDGENEKFIFGESSVFLLNKRQEKYINGQLKLIEIFIKQRIEILNFLYLSNQLIKQ